MFCEVNEYKNNNLNGRAANARSYQEAITIIKEYKTIIQRLKSKCCVQT